MHDRDKTDVVTTLAICALLTQDNAAVQRCALTLMDDSSLALQKSLLTPLVESEGALDIVMNECAFPAKEMRLGFVWRGQYEYEIIGIAHELDNYDVRDVVSTVAETFVDWGIYDGRIKMRVLHPTDGSFKYHYADLNRQAGYRYSAVQAA